MVAVNEGMRLQLAPMRLVDRPQVVTPEIDHYAPAVERISVENLIRCYRDRIAARKEGVTRLGDLDVLRCHAELYRRQVEQLWELVSEMDALEASRV